MSDTEQNIISATPPKSSCLSRSESSDDEYQFPDTFEGFGYKFNEYGQLVNIEKGTPYNFEERKDDHAYNQRRYEAIGELVTDYVYNLIMREGNLTKMTVPIDANETDLSTFIFRSYDAFTNEKLIVLIHGSGVVRAGQWARRLIINDCLNTGTQLPFINRAKGLGYGVIVLNTNDNTREVKGKRKKIKGNETAENHASYVWANVIATVAAKYIAIIAHSYGGVVTVNTCNMFPSSFQKKVCAIAFTDSPHSLVGQGTPMAVREYLRNVARNWVSCHQPLDTPLPQGNSQEIECLSAGTPRHDLTSWTSFASIYEFIDLKVRQSALAAYSAQHDDL